MNNKKQKINEEGGSSLSPTIETLLPLEILVHIFSYLRLPTQHLLLTVSKRFHDAVKATWSSRKCLDVRLQDIELHAAALHKNFPNIKLLRVDRNEYSCLTGEVLRHHPPRIISEDEEDEVLTWKMLTHVTGVPVRIHPKLITDEIVMNTRETTPSLEEYLKRGHEPTAIVLGIHPGEMLKDVMLPDSIKRLTINTWFIPSPRSGGYPFNGINPINLTEFVWIATIGWGLMDELRTSGLFMKCPNLETISLDVRIPGAHPWVFPAIFDFTDVPMPRLRRLTLMDSSIFLFSGLGTLVKGHCSLRMSRMADAYILTHVVNSFKFPQGSEMEIIYEDVGRMGDQQYKFLNPRVTRVRVEGIFLYDNINLVTFGNQITQLDLCLGSSELILFILEKHPNLERLVATVANFQYDIIMDHPQLKYLSIRECRDASLLTAEKENDVILIIRLPMLEEADINIASYECIIATPLVTYPSVLKTLTIRAKKVIFRNWVLFTSRCPDVLCLLSTDEVQLRWVQHVRIYSTEAPISKHHHHLEMKRAMCRSETMSMDTLNARPLIFKGIKTKVVFPNK